MNWPLLSIVVWLPIIGGVLVMLIGSNRATLAKQVALAASVVTFVISIPLYTQVVPARAAMQFVESVPNRKSTRLNSSH